MLRQADKRIEVAVNASHIARSVVDSLRASTTNSARFYDEGDATLGSIGGNVFRNSAASIAICPLKKKIEQQVQAEYRQC
jgi:hypothetical protein